MVILRTPDELAPYARGVLVPTMGGLHAGHASLVRLAAQRRDAHRLGPVIASVFVNPAQFEEPVDFERYPRDLDTDAAVLEDAGADAVFAPAPETVYPPGAALPDPPPLAVAEGPGLEDRFRPGHLRGVARVLARLFDLVSPAEAVFGEKDWQQLRLADALVRALGLPVSVVPGPTVREPGGLAMSSRNRFLTAGDRTRAEAIAAALCLAAAEDNPGSAEHAMRAHLDAHALDTEYAVVRDAETLLAPRSGRPCRALIAARLGAVRLIDNAPWPASG